MPALEKVSYAKNLATTCSLMGLYAGSAIFGKYSIRDRDRRLEFFTKNVGTYTRRVLKNFNFDIHPVGYDAKLMSERNFLLVGNHLSYLDVLVLSSVQPCVFVTSVDMGEQFFLGDMAELGGSIFVERRHRGQIGNDIGVMAQTLRKGHNVVVYPEGTSSNGERVLPFKKSLLMSAVEAGVDVLPVVIKYTHINGEPFGPSNRDRVCWYGDMNFLPHFLGLMTLKNVRVEMHFLDPIAVSKESTRHELAEKTYGAISTVYGTPGS